MLVKKWVLKAIVQKTISYLPGRRSINYLFQKYVTKGVFLSDDYFYDRLLHAREHLESYRRFAGSLEPAVCLEIGTGWYPVVPITFFLAGATTIYSVDIEFLTSTERLKTTLQRVVEAADQGRLAEYVSVWPERYAALKQVLAEVDALPLNEALRRLHITYLIEDARKLSLPPDSIDLINSNNTFEHIYPAILIPIMAEFKRVVKKQGGVMSHFIDMSDHFAHFDREINIYNFLRFSEREWQLIDNSIQPMSRLRLAEYRRIWHDLHIPISAETVRPGSVQELATVPLDAHYAAQPAADVAVSHCHLVSSFGASAAPAAQADAAHRTADPGGSWQ